MHALQAQEQVINQTLNREFARADFFVWLTVFLRLTFKRYCSHTSFLYMLIRMPFGIANSKVAKTSTFACKVKSSRQTVTSSGQVEVLQYSNWSCSYQMSPISVAVLQPTVSTAQAAEVNQRISVPTADSVAIFVAKINNPSETRWHLGCTAFV